MVSYIKTQWGRVLISLFCLLYAIHFMAQPAPDESTLEGVKLASQYMISCTSWMVSALLWLGISISNWHEDCIRELEKRLKKVEEHAITDLDPEGNGNYTARRRCGPDKDVPYPGEESTIEERITTTDKTFAYLKSSQDVLGFVPAESESLTLTEQQLKAIAFKVWEDKK